MSNFLFVYSGGEMPEESEMPAVMKAWESWYTELGDAVVDPGNPMSFGKTVLSDGTINDNPLGPNGTGYTIVKADSLESATKMAGSCPVLDGGSDISIFETFQVMS